MSPNTKAIRELAAREYKWGFVTKIDEERVPAGLSEEVIRLISAKKGEPEFMLEWRLKTYRHWASLEKAQAEPKWANIKYPPIDYQSIVYYSAPQNKASLKSLDELDPEILRTYEKLGIPLQEQKRLAGVAVDAVFDSVSVATTFKKKAGPTQTHPSEQLTREASHRSVMEQGRVQQQLVSIQNGGNLQSSASLSIPVAKRKGPFDIAPLQSGGTP